jgi:hypothetical protein
MSFRRVGRLAAMVIPTLLCLSCGQVYRPVVIPCSAGGGIPGCPILPPPTPASFHAVFGISLNVPNNPGGAMQIDVAGDSIIAETSDSDPKFGEGPTHAAILPNSSRRLFPVPEACRAEWIQFRPSLRQFKPQPRLLLVR